MKRALFGITRFGKYAKYFLASMAFILQMQEEVSAQGKGNWTWGGEMDPLQEQFEVVHYSLEIGRAHV